MNTDSIYPLLTVSCILCLCRRNANSVGLKPYREHLTWWFCTYVCSSLITENLWYSQSVIVVHFWDLNTAITEKRDLSNYFGARIKCQPGLVKVFLPIKIQRHPVKGGFFLLFSIQKSLQREITMSRKISQMSCFCTFFYIYTFYRMHVFVTYISFRQISSYEAQLSSIRRAI